MAEFSWYDCQVTYEKYLKWKRVGLIKDARSNNRRDVLNIRALLTKVASFAC